MWCNMVRNIQSKRNHLALSARVIFFLSFRDHHCPGSDSRSVATAYNPVDSVGVQSADDAINLMDSYYCPCKMPLLTCSVARAAQR